MRKSILVVAMCFVIVSVGLSGCIGIGAGHKTTKQIPTMGEELMDLKKARDTGAISAEEFDELKTRLKSPGPCLRSRKCRCRGK